MNTLYPKTDFPDAYFSRTQFNDSPLFRIAASGSLAAIITLGLFFAMQSLIINDLDLPPKIDKIIIKLPDIRKPTEIKPKGITAPPIPQNIEHPPIDINPPTNTITSVGLPPIVMKPPLVNKGFNPINNMVNGEMHPLAALSPAYPNRMAQRGIEGYAVIAFDVTKTGKVINAHVVESSHKGFERTSLKTIVRFKYKPRVVDGEPVLVRNAYYKFSYTLEK